MNSLYNTALRQSRAIHSDLDRIIAALDSGNAIPPSEIGSASASLTTFTKAIEDYHAMARQEIIPKKQDEAIGRVKKFREDLADFRARIDIVKKQREDAAHRANRADLLGRRPYATGTPENPYASANAGGAPSAFAPSAGPSAPQGGYGAPPQALGGYSFGSGDSTRENHALKEQAFFQRTNTVLDEYIAQGQAMYGDLKVQNGMLKNVQKKLYSAANTLGISGDTIRMVERRAREDKWIFAVGVVVFLLFCWLVVHFLG